MAASTQAQIEQFQDGVDNFGRGVNSGDPPNELPRDQLAWATNATVRGKNVRPRPPRRKMQLTLNDSTISLAAIFQGATYYQPDFGAQSIVAAIGGRLYQFIPNPSSGATVYDRTIQNVVSSITGQASGQTVVTVYPATVTNVNDSSNTGYPVGTPLLSFYPSSSSIAETTEVSLPPNNETYTLTLKYTSASGLPPGTVFQVEYDFTFSVLNVVNAEAGTYLVKFTNSLIGGSGSSVIAQNANVSISNTPTSTVVGNLQQPMPAIAEGSSETIYLQAAYTGTSEVTIGNGQYYITALPPIEQTVTAQSLPNIPASVSGGYDTNSADNLQSWLWQGENYVFCNDGKNKTIIFNGISSRRANTATYSGTTTAPFKIPPVGGTVTIELSEPFNDNVGRFVQISGVGLFPFLMEVLAINGAAITVANINGLAAVQSSASVPSGSSVQSVTNNSYLGYTANNITMPAQQGTVLISLSPAFNGAVGDTIYLTDATGPVTQYEMTVAAITNNGLQISATNINAPQLLIVNSGYPVISENTIPNELPIGRMGYYAQGRNWISLPNGTQFIASDQVGDSTGTAQYNFRDAILKWSLNTTQFSVPGGAGQINCIIPLSTLDASLGQGPLQVLCDNDIFSVSAPSNAAEWSTTTNPIVTESAIGFGGSGANAAVVCNADLIMKSGDGTIHSLLLAAQDDYQWGNLPISREVDRVVQNEDIDLLQYISAEQVDNRMLMSAAPIQGPNGIYGQGLIALDFDVTSSLQGKAPSVYDGFWNGFNVLQLITGKFGNSQRTFAFVSNLTTSEIELWEILTTGTMDDDGSGPTVPIVWSFELPVLFNKVKGKGEFDFIRLQDGEIYISDLIGTGTVKSWYRPDFDPCWYPWHSFEFSARDLPRLGLGKPEFKQPDASGQRPPVVGRMFQMRFEMTGSFIFKGAVFSASREAQPYRAPVLAALKPSTTAP